MQARVAARKTARSVTPKVARVPCCWRPPRQATRRPRAENPNQHQPATGRCHQADFREPASTGGLGLALGGDWKHAQEFTRDYAANEVGSPGCEVGTE